MSKYTDVAIIVPAYNEGGVVRSIIDSLTKNFTNVICVNDGSRDNTLEELRKTKAVTLSHLTNIGQGGAIETGVKYALSLPQVEYFVTFDSDGQHRIEDVKKMIEKIKSSGVDIMLGSRNLSKNQKESNMPATKRLVLKTALLFTNLTIGLKLTDTHNGLRVFNRTFAKAINLKNFQMAHASEILELIKKKGFKYEEMPILIKYSDYSKKHSNNPTINAVNIVFDLFLK